MSAGSVVVGKQTGFVNAVRRNGSVTAAAEKRLLVWMAERVPAWVSSDGLTLLGFGAQIAAGACYALARYDRRWLALGIWCIVLNWLGDSLDGTLARVRRHQRPRYGFYVDHLVDAFGALFLLGGLGLSGYMSPLIAVALLVAYLLLLVETFLATYSLGTFKMSYFKIGPTELRILLAIGNLVLLVHPMADVFGREYRLFDVGGAVATCGMLATLAFAAVTNTRALYAAEPLPGGADQR